MIKFCIFKMWERIVNMPKLFRQYVKSSCLDSYTSKTIRKGRKCKTMLIRWIFPLTKISIGKIKVKCFTKVVYKNVFNFLISFFRFSPYSPEWWNIFRSKSNLTAHIQCVFTRKLWALISTPHTFSFQTVGFVVVVCHHHFSIQILFFWTTWFGILCSWYASIVC